MDIRSVAHRFGTATYVGAVSGAELPIRTSSCYVPIADRVKPIMVNLPSVRLWVIRRAEPG
jgi:hypothetical protein